MSVSDWFLCPYCGDDGKVVQSVGFGEANIEFTCQSTEHKRNTGTQQHFHREKTLAVKPEREDVSRLPDLLDTAISVFTEGRDKNKFSSLSSCVQCPHCTSSRADGALELFVFSDSFDTNERCSVMTVWCRVCGESERSPVTHAGSDVSKSQLASLSRYPPTRVEPRKS